MSRLLLIPLLCLVLAPLPSLCAQLDPDCERATPEDLWNYKDEYVPVEYSHEPFLMEALDIAVLALMLIVGGVYSRRRKGPLPMRLLMGIGLAYFGILRGGCICPVGSISNVTLGMIAPELVGKLVVVLFLLPLVASFFVGRVFCSTACPLGALQDLASRKRSFALPRPVNRLSRLLPLMVLVLTIWVAWRGTIWLACRIDVYKLVFFTGYAWLGQLIMWMKGAVVETRFLLVGDLAAWGILATVMLLGLLVPRPFCRFACPYGVLLGVMSAVGLRRRGVDSGKCPGCGRCEAVCPVQAITPSGAERYVKISSFHCIQCGRCDNTCKAHLISG